MAPTSSLARCGQPLTKAFPVVGSGSRMPTELAARAMATPGRGAATPDLVSGVDPVVLASSTPAAAGVPAAAKVVQLHLATASAVASASVLTSTTLGSGGCTSSPAPKSPPSVRPEVAAGVMIGTGSEASRQKPGPSCLDEPSVGGAIAVFTLDDLADSVLEAGVSADGNLGGGLGCVQVPAQSSTGSPTDVVVRRSKGNAATTDVDSIKKASKAVAIRNLDNPGDIRGTHWSRCWSLLQKEEERLMMKMSCRLFETVVLEIFANNDRDFSNRITF